VNKPFLIESKTVFVPRGTATYTPKWSIVVLAVACLGVLKFNGPRAKTSAGWETSEGKTAASETVGAASLPTPIETTSQIHAPGNASDMETNSTAPASSAQLQNQSKNENQ
jgi:hypothetical protein